MFTYISPQHVKSDEGFEVFFESRDKLVYRSRRREIEFFFEIGVDSKDRPDILVYAETPTDWVIKRGEQPIDSAERRKVVGNLTAALSFLEVRHQIG